MSSKKLSDTEISGTARPERMEEIPERVERVVEYVETHAFTLSGPLPPPEMIRQYNEAEPGLGDRIVKWTEAESEHRRTLEITAQEQSIELNRRGQVFGVSVALGSLAMAGLVGVFSAIHGSLVGAICAVLVAAIGVGGPSVARIVASRNSVSESNRDAEGEDSQE